MRLTYWPFEKIGGHESAPFGALLISAMSAADLPAADRPIYNSDSYVVFSVKGGEVEAEGGKRKRFKADTQQTSVISSLNPKWRGEHAYFFKVCHRTGPSLRLRLAQPDPSLGRARPRLCPQTSRSILTPTSRPLNHHPRRQVPVAATLELEVLDRDSFSSDERLGTLSVDLRREVALAPGGDLTKTWKLQGVRRDWMAPGSEAAESTITMRLQWIPFKMAG